MSLLMIRHVLSLGVGNAPQAAGQVDPQPLAGDPRGGEEVSKHLPVCGQVASLFKQFTLRCFQRRLPGHVTQASWYLPEQPADRMPVLTDQRYQTRLITPDDPDLVRVPAALAADLPAVRHLDCVPANADD